MVTKERIQEYCDWFKINRNSFVIDEIENLWRLNRFIETRYYPIVKNYKIGDVSYSKMTLEECLNLAEGFFKKHNIQIDIRKMIEDGTLEFKHTEFKDALFGSILTGESTYDKDGKRKEIVNIEGTFLDCVSIVHELMHYLNQPPIRRNSTSYLLTETISYGMELIFIEELKGTTYESDRALYYKRYVLMMYSYAYEIYYIYKIILLFKRRESLTEEAYQSVFKDDEYLLTLEKFEEFAKEKRSASTSTRYIIGFPLAIYFLEECRKDSSFIDTIVEFSNAINDKTLFDCLSIVHINSKEELMEKIIASSDSFIELLSSLDMEKNI